MYISIYQCYLYSIILVLWISESRSKLYSNRPVENFQTQFTPNYDIYLRGIRKAKAYCIPSAAINIKNYAAQALS